MTFLKRAVVSSFVLFHLVSFSSTTLNKTLEVNNLNEKPTMFSVWSFENGIPKKIFSGKLEKGNNTFQFDSLNLPPKIIGIIGINVKKNYLKAYYNSEDPINIVVTKNSKLVFSPKDQVNYSIQKKISKLTYIQKAIIKLDESKSTNSEKRGKFLKLYNNIRTHKKLNLPPLAEKFLEASYFTTDYSVDFNNTESFSRNQIDHFFDFYDPSDIDFKNTLIHSSKVAEYLSFCNRAFGKKGSHTEFKKAIDTYLDHAMFNSDMYDFAIEELTEMIPRIVNSDDILEYLDSHYSPTNCKSDSKYSLEKKQRLELYKRTGIGRLAPNFSWEKGNSLYKIKSEKTVILFWSSTCIHCTKNVPLVYKKIGRNNSKTTIIAVSLDRKKENWKSFYTLKNLKGWHHIFNRESKENISKLYGVRGTPYYIVLDKDKRVLLKTYNTTRLYTELGIN